VAVAYKKDTVSYGIHRYVIERWSQASAGDTQQTCSTNPAADPRAAVQPRHLLAVYVTYSDVVTLDVTVTLDSGLGSAYDCLFASLPFAAGKAGVYLPSSPLPLMSDDIVAVVAPAGGVGVTSQIIIVSEITEL
jgi:hypothetical protein